MFNRSSQETVAAKVLHSVLLVALPVSVLSLGVLVPLFAVRKIAAGAFWLVIVIFTLVCILLLRRGNVRLSSWLFLSTSWLTLALFVVFSGGIRSPGVLSQIAIIVVSIWLLGRREAIWIAALSLIFGLNLAIMESVGIHLPRYFPVMPILAWGFAVGLVCLTILPLASVHQALADSSEQAQREVAERRQTEEILRSSQQRLELAQAAAGIGSYERDERTGIASCSSGFPALYGLPPSEVGPSYEQWVESIHPDDRAAMLERRAGTLKSGDSWETEYRVIWPDGSVHWLFAKGMVLRDLRRNPTGTIGVNIDITERKHAEEILRSSQRRLELAQAAAGIGSYERDERTGIVRCSSGFPALYGLPPSEVGPSYDQWLESIHPDDRAMTLEKPGRAVEKGDSWETEFRVIWPDGSVHWLFAKGLLMRDSLGNPTGTIGVHMDITGRKQAEETLRSSQQRLELAQAAAGIGSYEWDVNTGVGRCSELFPALYGLPPAEIGPPQEQWLERIHPDDRAGVLEQLAQTLAGNGSCNIEFRVIWPDGTLHWLFARGTLLRDSRGNPSRTVGVNMDITERKRAHEEAITRQKLEGLGVLAGGIAHDFNNLLGSILAESEMLLEEVAGNATAREGVSSIMAVANRATGIVRELMAYAGKGETVFEPVDLSRLVREMVQFLRTSISKHAELQIDLPEGLPSVRANAAQISQVVMNLIINASESLGEKHGVISVGVAESEDHVRLEVNDTGCGMTEEVKAQIFDPFFSTKFAGRGMGLAAVQGIIRKHRGMINVASVPGQGSVFTILLPSITEPALGASGSTLTVSDTQGEATVGTVLVIEDEEPLRHAVTKWLRKKGFRVIEASDGRGGVDLFKAHEHTIDAVLLDMTLPSLPGREVLRELRRIRTDVNVILTTAYSQDSALEALGGQQPWRFIRKPYQLSELVELLRDACQDRRQ